MIKHRADSIQKLNDEQAAEAKKDKTIPWMAIGAPVICRSL